MHVSIDSLNLMPRPTLLSSWVKKKQKKFKFCGQGKKMDNSIQKWLLALQVDSHLSTRSDESSTTPD